jgi:hypothetical protein
MFAIMKWWQQCRASISKANGIGLVVNANGRAYGFVNLAHAKLRT